MIPAKRCGKIITVESRRYTGVKIWNFWSGWANWQTANIYLTCPGSSPQDVLNKLQALDLGEYSLQELAEAACYIAGEKKACATREEAVQAIAEAWTKK